MAKLKISKLKIKVGELFRIKKVILNYEKLHDFSFNEIGRLFLTEILNISIEQLDFITIRNKYIEVSEDNAISKNENDFYKEICFDYLNLKKEPKETLYSLYQEVSKDLEKIEKNILYIDDEIEELDKKKQNKNILYNIEDRYYFYQLNFYKEKNITAKNEIIDFLVYDIKNYAINESQYNLININFYSNSLFKTLHYKFYKSLFMSNYYDEYDIKELTPISNKFLNAPIQEYNEIKNLYYSDKEEFFKFTKEYMAGKRDYTKNTIDELTTFIKTNHILNRRKEALKSIINHYKNEDYISVVNMLPLQIEGIFHDICVELGISESELSKTSINELLKLLDEESHSFHYFEYYSFIFPITRNKVAHGKLIEDNLEHTAIMLLLDLIPVCEFATSEELKINKAVNLIKTIKEKNKYQKLTEFIDYIDIDIPDFYNINSSKEKILCKYQEDAFWDYLFEEIKKENSENINDSKICKYVKKLKKKEIVIERCNIFLKNISKL